MRNAYFKNQSGVYCVPFGNSFEEDKKDVNAKIFDDMWEGISKAEVFYVENESFGCGASFIEWIRTLDSGCAQYHMPNFFVNHGKPSKHKVKFSWDNKKMASRIVLSIMRYMYVRCEMRRNVGFRENANVVMAYSFVTDILRRLLQQKRQVIR